MFKLGIAYGAKVGLKLRLFDQYVQSYLNLTNMDKLFENDLYVWTNLSEFDQYGKN